MKNKYAEYMRSEMNLNYNRKSEGNVGYHTVKHI